MTTSISRLAAGLLALAMLAGGAGPSIAQASSHDAHAARHHKRHHKRHHRSRIPQHNGGDHDSDNNGGPSDGDGNV
jgi:hypothetical protein